jgi:hypothetical protein
MAFLCFSPGKNLSQIDSVRAAFDPIFAESEDPLGRKKRDCRGADCEYIAEPRSEWGVRL